MEPASIRYKNPGAMWGNKLAAKWGAAKKAVSLNDGTGQGNNIAVFPTYVQGICAQLDLWRTSKNYRNKRFSDAIRIWSGGNHVESYIAFVLKRVPGMTRNTIMDDVFWRGPMGIEFLKAQAWHEASKRYPAPDADWIEAQRRVFAGKLPTAGPKTKATVAAGAGTGAAAGAVEGGLPLWVAIMVGVGIAIAIFVIWKIKSAPAAATSVIPADLPAVDIEPPPAVEVAP
ncbi:MAG: hypothetical protein ABIL01_20775 [Pseudomonadota bacterium]